MIKKTCLPVTNVSTRLELWEYLKYITTVCTRIYGIHIAYVVIRQLVEEVLENINR